MTTPPNMVKSLSLAREASQTFKGRVLAVPDAGFIPRVVPLCQRNI